MLQRFCGLRHVPFQSFTLPLGMLYALVHSLKLAKRITEIVYAKHLAEANAICCGQPVSEHFFSLQFGFDSILREHDKGRQH